MSPNDTKLVLYFDVDKPVELMVLTASFDALGRQYRNHVAKELPTDGKKPKDKDIKLYVTKIENNSILIELLTGAIDVLGDISSVRYSVTITVEVVKKINAKIQYFRKVAKQAPEDIKASEIPFSKGDCQDVANILEVIQDKGGMKLSAVKYQKETKDTKILFEATFNSDEAFEAKKGALLAQDILEKTDRERYENVLMYYHQANTDELKSEGPTGEKAIIKAISPKPLPVYIISDLDKGKIASLKNDPNQNIFKPSYRVDIEVERDRNNIPKFYRVVKLHEIIPDD